MSKERKVDLFVVLDKLSKKDQTYYCSLSEEDQKEILPILIMRWLSGTSNAYQVFLINEIVNTYVFSLHKHKELLVNLLLTSTSGKGSRYNWLKTKSKKGMTAPLTCKLITNYYQISSRQAIDYLKLLEEIDIIGYAEELGYQQDDIKKIKTELKAYYVNKG